MKVNELIKKVKMYQKTKEDYLFETIIEYFKPCINKQINMIDKAYQEDSKQEIMNKIYYAIINFNIKIDYSKINEGTKDQKFIKFKKQYLKNNNDDMNLFKKIEYEYLLNINQCQFIKYIKKICINERISFYNKNIKKYENVISLNESEVLDVINDNYINKNEEMFQRLNKSEMKFIKSFFDKGRLLKNKEVAKRLNVTPQAVSMRKKRIIEKYKIM